MVKIKLGKSTLDWREMVNFVYWVQLSSNWSVAVIESNSVQLFQIHRIWPSLEITLVPLALSVTQGLTFYLTTKFPDMSKTETYAEDKMLLK